MDENPTLRGEKEKYFFSLSVLHCSSIYSHLCRVWEGRKRSRKKYSRLNEVFIKLTLNSDFSREAVKLFFHFFFQHKFIRSFVYRKNNERRVIEKIWLYYLFVTVQRCVTEPRSEGTWQRVLRSPSISSISYSQILKFFTILFSDTDTGLR